jgi:predicted Rossmann-fold nucleotide-binding protein
MRRICVFSGSNLGHRSAYREAAAALGGLLEEIFEVWTWGQLGSHSNPCAFLNTQGFYNRLLDFLDHVVDEAILKSPGSATGCAGGSGASSGSVRP